jgi:hypothetical protein
MGSRADWQSLLEQATGSAAVNILKVALPLLVEEIRALRLRVDSVESKGLRYRGVHQRADEYRKGDAVTQNGNMWVCLRETTGTPGASEDWQLAVRAGRDLR